MKLLTRILCLAFLVSSCCKNMEEGTDSPLFRHDTQVIVVFPPAGIGDQTEAALIYQGAFRATDSLGLAFCPIFPSSYKDGVETLSQLVKSDVVGRKRLIVAADYEYSARLRRAVEEGDVVDSDSTKLLVLDGDLTHPDIYTAYVPVYGMMYKAGYVASKMTDVESVRIYIANHKYRYIREGKDGFIDGFNQNKEGYFDVYDFSTINEDDTEGFYKSTLAYIYDAPECSGLYDMVLPLCGETVMGFLRYSREYPGCFYTVGVTADMSAYSSDVPFSCVEHLDRVVVSCIADWSKERLAHHRTFGMDEGWVELVIPESYSSMLQPVADEIHAQAIKLEGRYEK